MERGGNRSGFDKGDQTNRRQQRRQADRSLFALPGRQRKQAGVQDNRQRKNGEKATVDRNTQKVILAQGLHCCSASSSAAGKRWPTERRYSLAATGSAANSAGSGKASTSFMSRPARAA